MLKRNPLTHELWTFYKTCIWFFKTNWLRYLMFFQDSYHLTSIFKKSYIALLLQTDLIQPRLDLTLYLGIILNFWFPCSTSRYLATGMRCLTQLAVLLDDWIWDETGKLLKTCIFVVTFYLVALAGLNLLCRPDWPLNSCIWFPSAV